MKKGLDQNSFLIIIYLSNIIIKYVFVNIIHIYKSIIIMLLLIIYISLLARSNTKIFI